MTNFSRGQIWGDSTKKLDPFCSVPFFGTSDARKEGCLTHFFGHFPTLPTIIVYLGLESPDFTYARRDVFRDWLQRLTFWQQFSILEEVDPQNRLNYRLGARRMRRTVRGVVPVRSSPETPHPQKKNYVVAFELHLPGYLSSVNGLYKRLIRSHI